MLKAENLTKRYGALTALNDLNLTNGEGEIFTLLGQNGAGKTATINLFLGFVEPSEGSASINGVKVTGNALETNKYIAYIPETVMLYPNLSGFENLEFFSSMAGFHYDDEELYPIFDMKSNIMATVSLSPVSLNHIG